MDISNYFYKDLALFGSYPTQQDVIDLENEGVSLFVNLTTFIENLPSYNTSKKYINFPIRDTKIPDNNYKFALLIIYLEDSIKRKEKIFIHCRGGHGRSALVAACLLCKMKNIDAKQSIEIVSFSHNTRKKMADKYRNILVPNSKVQRFYLSKIYEPLYFSKSIKNSEKNGFSSTSLHPVELPGVGTFPNSEIAFFALRNLDDNLYIQSLLNSKNTYLSKLISDQYNQLNGALNTDVNLDYMYTILKLKFMQNRELKDRLLMTGFRPIINHNKFDNFWGDNGDGSGNNYLGKLLVKIRDEYYKIKNL
jgi:ribA/ribD-fused uncharacterized protein